MIVSYLRKFHLRKTLRSIGDVRFSPYASRVRVKFRATPAFAPAVLEGMTVELQLESGSMWGKLQLVPASEPRGLWYEYDFLIDPGGILASVIFEGQCHWSNIRSIVLDPFGANVAFKNRFTLRNKA